MVALRKPPLMTVDEFLAWTPPDRSGQRWQLVDGQPVAMAPGSLPHGEIQSEIGRLIGNHLITQGSRCRIITTPGVVPRAGAGHNFRIPDLGVTCEPRSRDMIMQDPLLLIEILSPSNEAATRSNIWSYTTIPSVREILAVRSTRVEAELLRRLPDGYWPAEPVVLTGTAGLTLTSIGFSVDLASFYRTTDLV